MRLSLASILIGTFILVCNASLQPRRGAGVVNGKNAFDQAAWMSYLSNILMDLECEWASTELNRSIAALRQQNPSAAALQQLIVKIGQWAQELGTRVQQAAGSDVRARQIFEMLKLERVDEATRFLAAPSPTPDSPDLAKIRLAVRVITADALLPRTIIRFWSPHWRLTLPEKIAIMNYWEVARKHKCLDDDSVLQNVRYKDAVRLRILTALNLDTSRVIESAGVDLTRDERNLCTLASYYQQGQLCSMGRVRAEAEWLWDDPIIPQYAKILERARSVCQSDLLWANYRDYCQVGDGQARMPLGMSLSQQGCHGAGSCQLPDAVGRLEQLFWGLLWIGDCERARETMVAIRDSLGRTLLENPAIITRYNYIVTMANKCRPSPRASEFSSSSIMTGIIKLLEFGHYDNALLDWRMFHSANCRLKSALADDLELLIRIAANPRAVYAPALTNSMLTGDRTGNLEVLRMADRLRAQDGSAILGEMGPRTREGNRLRMRAAMIAGRLALARDYARLLVPYSDREAQEVLAATSLCQNPVSSCTAIPLYQRLMSSSSTSSTALGNAIASAMCSSRTRQSYDPIVIKYDLVFSVQENLRRVRMGLEGVGACTMMTAALPSAAPQRQSSPLQGPLISPFVGTGSEVSVMPPSPFGQNQYGQIPLPGISLRPLQPRQQQAGY